MRRIGLWVVVLLVSAALFGCKKDGGEAAPGTPGEEAATKTGEAAAAEGEEKAAPTAAGDEAAAEGEEKAPAKGEAPAKAEEKAAAGGDPLAPPPDVAAAPADAETTASGLASKVLQPGTGSEHPGERDKVTVHYTGWTTDGKMFDSSVKRGTPATFPLNRVIKGWTEGLQLMVAGEKRRFWIPGPLAYGDRPTRPGAPAGTLVFDVELISFEKAPTVDAPPDVAAPPADAKKTASGLAYKQLQAGRGETHPAASDTVEVHYTGWTKDGEMFDSSVVRGRPATFPLNRVIKGWTEGLQLMVEGEKMRFWIPGDLAYGDKPARPGAPAGTLVFDVELIDIK